MRRSLEERSVQVIDTTSALRRAYADGAPRLYDRVTIHLSPSGHRTVASASAERLGELLRSR